MYGTGESRCAMLSESRTTCSSSVITAQLVARTAKYAAAAAAPSTIGTTAAAARGTGRLSAGARRPPRACGGTRASELTAGGPMLARSPGPGGAESSEDTVAHSMFDSTLPRQPLSRSSRDRRGRRVRRSTPRHVVPPLGGLHAAYAFAV